ncbi:MAG TPA: 3-methyl-2-oxobutanoate hydroxymethyltransferase [Holophagaceae bacterium]|nr:3-methyl-2-oxobutanoate hydroxymethyltransferase [Holophagaceae bacterium]
MSHAPSDAPSPSRPRVTLPQLQQGKQEGRPLVMLTAYDAPTARIADAAGVDILLVGDSLGNVCLGFETTLPVTMAMMNHHLEAVARAKPAAFLVADMPYLSFHLGIEDTLRNAGGFLQRGAQAVKLEGGAKRVPVIRALVDAEIPVMGHLGLTPQSVNPMGGFKVQGRAEADALAILEDAQALQEAGCFSIVLEGIPADLAARVTETLRIPTLGIGAGLGCSGQVLVFHDLLGLLPERPAKFVRKYMDGFDLMRDATARWAEDVRSGAFPGPAESYKLPEEIRPAVASWQPGRRR